ncbi:MAG: carbon-nitrogen hydrolase family protein [Halothiobacillaceae bacterium]|nr:carbon-nitrogen hydrolase family protein [Halothiobacillaceae bacterium]
MNTPAKVAAIQMNGKASWQENQPIIERLVHDAAEAGAAVIVLPENVYAMPANPHDLLALGFNEPDDPVLWLKNLARTQRVWLVAGTLPILAPTHAKAPRKLPGKLLARTYVIDSDGEIRTHYDKIHLFDVTVPAGIGQAESYRESDLFQHGETPVVVDTPAGRLGLAICFDLRFPELFRHLTELGATWICLPAAFTQVTGSAHWEPLLRARAIENQVFMVAAAQVGTHASGRQTYGHSLIIDAWGQVLANANTLADCFVLAPIDRVAQSHIRQQFPVLALRREIRSV